MSLPETLAEAFGSKPVRPTLLQLIDQLVDANLDGSNQEEGSDAEEVYAIKVETIHREIELRLEELGAA